MVCAVFVTMDVTTKGVVIEDPYPHGWFGVPPYGQTDFPRWCFGKKTRYLITVVYFLHLVTA